MFEEKVTISVEVLETAELQITTKTAVTKDGKVLSTATHYNVLQPGADVSMWPAQIQKVAAATWTPENIAPVTAKVQEAIKEQQAAITEAAAKKLEAEAETAAHEAAKKAAEVAKAAAQAAEAEAKAAADSCEAQCTRLKQAEAAKAAAQAAYDAAHPAVPPVISKRQGRAQLKVENLLALVEAYMASLPADETTRMAYEDATEWRRTDPNVITVMTALGKNDVDADAFFVAASEL